MSAFKDFLSIEAAAERWGKEPGDILEAIKAGKLVEGKDCQKFGDQWVVTIHGMSRVFSRRMSPWGIAQMQVTGDCVDCKWRYQTYCHHAEPWWLHQTEDGHCKLHEKAE